MAYGTNNVMLPNMDLVKMYLRSSLNKNIEPNKISKNCPNLTEAIYRQARMLSPSTLGINNDINKQNTMAINKRITKYFLGEDFLKCIALQIISPSMYKKLSNEK